MEVLPPAFNALATRPQFIIYQVTPSKNRPNKMDKIPVDPVTLKRIDCLDSKNHMTADQALATCKKLKATEDGDYGVGFVFTPEDDFFFIDIDNCVVQSGEKLDWSPLAKKIMEAFPNAAMEISTSGVGIHIIGRGKISAHGCRNAKYGLEFYTEKRFVALTGTSARGDANTVHTAALTAHRNEYLRVRGTSQVAISTNDGKSKLSAACILNGTVRLTMKS